MQRFKILFLLIGIAFLVYAIHATGGVASMMVALLNLGWWFPLAFIPTVIAQWLRTIALRLILEKGEARPSMKVLWRIRLIGEALNYLTFAGPLLGDPTKASLLSSETECRKPATSIGIDRYLYALASVLFILLAGMMWFGARGAACISVVGLAAVLSPKLIRRFGNSLSGRTAFTVIGLHLLANMFMALEAAVLLKGLGVNASMMEWASVEAINKGLNGIFFFLPMQVGVAEGASAMLFHAMNMSATVGLTLGLARRVRSMAWSIAGLVLMV